MKNQIIFTSEKKVRLEKVLRFILPTYLTFLFNTLYTIVNKILISQYMGTNVLAAISIGAHEKNKRDRHFPSAWCSHSEQVLQFLC